MLKRTLTRAVISLSLAGAVAGTAAAAIPAASSAASANPGLMTPGTLVVGMNLQFKPEMYVKNGQPAGYDVDLLHKLAAAMGVKLKIVNLAFTGLIPGLQTSKFDLVSVGLSNTPARSQVVTFTKPYVPYAQILAIPTKNAAGVKSLSALNKSGTVVTALLGSTDQTEAQKVFPNAKVTALADQNSDFSLVATGRANGIVVEDYLLAQYQAATPGKLVKASIPPLDVQYGSYAVQHGNTKLVAYLNKFLCTQSQNGTLAKLYKKNFGVAAFPGVPAC
jgi:ABC-type amino acid transport substrate-binding protein